MARRPSTLRRNVQAVLLIAPIATACIQLGPPAPHGAHPSDVAAAASADPKESPPGAPCVEGGEKPSRESNCCSGKVDSQGLCRKWPGHACGEDKECHVSEILASMRTSCLDGHCCLGIDAYCDNGTCCPGLECKPRQGAPMRPFSHSCVQVAPKELDQACTKNFDCRTQICRKGKCFGACIHENEKCGSDEDAAVGRGCCDGPKCSKLDPKTKQWAEVKPGEKGVCPPVLKGSGGCTAAGLQCDPSKPSGPGSVWNNCCGYCGLDGHCH
jgi:hypothetical protein